MVEPLGNIPGPYGKPIAVFASPDHPGEFFHNTDGCMDMAGIHDPKNRTRCRAELGNGNGQSLKFDVLIRNGGRKVPKVPLPRPRDPAYPRVPSAPGLNMPTEHWVTMAMDAPNWSDRASAFLDVLGSNLEQMKEWALPQDIAGPVQGLGLSLILTASLEHLTEPEIDCLEAAAFYALTDHDEWSEAAIEWLRPFRKTWFRDWVLARPVYREFANIMRTVNSDLPAWIAKGGAV